MKRCTYVGFRFHLVTQVVIASIWMVMTFGLLPKALAEDEVTILTIKSPEAVVTLTDTYGVTRSMPYESQTYGVEVSNKTSPSSVVRWVRRLIDDLRALNPELQISLTRVKDQIRGREAPTSLVTDALAKAYHVVPATFQAGETSGVKSNHSVTVTTTSINNYPVSVSLLDSATDLSTTMTAAETMAFVQGQKLGAQAQVGKPQGAGVSSNNSQFVQSMEKHLIEFSMKAMAQAKTFRQMRLPIKEYAAYGRTAAQAFRTYRSYSFGIYQNLLPEIYKFVYSSANHFSAYSLSQDPFGAVINASQAAWGVKVEHGKDFVSTVSPKLAQVAQTSAEWSMIFLKLSYKMMGTGMSYMNVDPMVSHVIYTMLLAAAGVSYYRSYVMYMQREVPKPVVAVPDRVRPVLNRLGSRLAPRGMTCGSSLLNKAKPATELFVAMPL